MATVTPLPCGGGGLLKPRPLLLHTCFTSFVGVKELVSLVGGIGSSCWTWRGSPPPTEGHSFMARDEQQQSGGRSKVEKRNGVVSRSR